MTRLWALARLNRPARQAVLVWAGPPRKWGRTARRVLFGYDPDDRVTLFRWDDVTIRVEHGEVGLTVTAELTESRRRLPLVDVDRGEWVDGVTGQYVLYVIDQTDPTIVWVWADGRPS
jgi:hypothetical protein